MSVDDTAPDASHEYKSCQSLVRGLDLLAAMNRNVGGVASISQLAQTVTLHRSTVKRLLETLRNQGYVQRDPETNLYRLTFRVQALAWGFRDAVWITESAWPHLRALTKSLVWPCTILTMEGDELVVRTSTRLYSPLSFHPGMPGRRVPLLTTAAGRALLAWSPPEEVEVLLQMLRARGDAGSALASNRDYIALVVRETRARGYAVNRGEWSEEKKFGGVAVPLRHEGRVLAILNVVFLLRAVTKEKDIAALGTTLAETGRRIEAGFGESRLAPD